MKRFSTLFLSLLVGALGFPSLFPSTAEAVHVIDPAQHDPATPPSNMPIGNLISFGGRSAIYLGDIAENGTYWLLTTGHGGAAPNNEVTIGSTIYSVGNDQIISNVFPGQTPVGDTGNADLRLVQVLTTAPPPLLPTLEIIPAPPIVGSLMVLAGKGAGGQIWATAPVSNSVGSLNPYGLTTVPGLPYRTYSFGTRVTLGATATPPDYGYAASGDSGGGVFHYDGMTGTWYIAGTMFAVNNTSGTNNRDVFAANLYHYADQIHDIAYTTMPVPEPGAYALLSTAALGILLYRRAKPSKAT